MKITTYRELQSKNELLPLMDQAFEWPFNPAEFEEEIKDHPRLKDNPVGYAAIENSQLVGFVGVMDLATRTLDGAKETVGGIWGVATHPAYAKRGISTALMQRSHQYFTEKDYRFALLTSGRPLVAYAFYQKLGYQEMVAFPSAYKVIEKRNKSTKPSAKKTKLDWRKILKIHNQATEDLTGLVVRDKQYGKSLKTRKKIQPEKSVITDEGYALLKEQEGNVAVQEIIAITTEALGKLIDLIEEKATKTITDRIVLDEKTLNTYQSHGYMVLEDSFNVLMAKPLEKISFREVYGEKFYMSNLDSF
jgi:predicted acetyltransferase